MRFSILTLSALIAGCVYFYWLPSHAEDSVRLKTFGTLPPIEEDKQKIALGRDLFFDYRLSGSQQMNCASCHDLDANGATGAPFDRNDTGQFMQFNTPTLFNSAYSFRFGWLGKHRTMSDQTLIALNAAMGGGGGVAVRQLAADTAMLRRFRNIYGDNPTENTIVDALCKFMHTLVTDDSPFDHWLNGNENALTAQQIRGYREFERLGCANCHQGRSIGANLIGRRGIFNPLGNPNPAYLRVPSLRNVAVTAPYFHDGSSLTLDDAVRRMARAQLDVTVNESEVADIVAFLESLTGEYEGSLLTPAKASVNE